MSESLNHKNYSQYIRFKVLVLVVLLTLLIFLALADLALGHQDFNGNKDYNTISASNVNRPED